MYETTTYLVGSSDDILPDQYHALARRLAGDVSPAAWVAADSNVLRFCKTVAEELAQPNILSDIVYVTGIPAGMRLMGQRYIPDSHILHNLTYDRIPGRYMPMGLDVMAVLGSDRAREYLVNLYQQDQYPGYLAKLDSMRATFAKFDSTQWNQNVYYGWLYALKLNLEPVKATSRRSLLAGFVRSEAYPDKTLVSTCGSWTQLRHDTILYAKQSYTTAGSHEVERNPPPDVAYVEPEPKLFRQLSLLGAKLQVRMVGFGVLNVEVAGKLKEFVSAATRLAVIADGELVGTQIGPEDAEFCKGIGGLQSRLTTFSQGFGKRYLSEQVAPAVRPAPTAPSLANSKTGEMTAVQSEAKRMHFGRETNVDKKMALVADVHTDAWNGKVLEEAVGNPCKVYAVIPFYGKQYLAVGACFSYYEFTKPMSERMTDEEWQTLKRKPPMPVWTKSFIVSE